MIFKRLFTVSAIIVITAACNNSDAVVADGSAVPGAGAVKQTTIQWIDSAKNFGKITEGQKLAVSFKFRNSGNQPLIIQSVAPSCGCTVADYPKEPIAPGAEGEITGVFDSHGREGLQHKELTVTANTPASEKIYFEVDVVAGKTASEPEAN